LFPRKAKVPVLKLSVKAKTSAYGGLDGKFEDRSERPIWETIGKYEQNNGSKL